MLCYCCEFVYYLTGATFITTYRSGKLLTAELFLIRLSSSSSAVAVTELAIKVEGLLRDSERKLGIDQIKDEVNRVRFGEINWQQNKR